MIYEPFTVLSAWVTLPEGLVRIGSLFSFLSPPCPGGGGGGGGRGGGCGGKGQDFYLVLWGWDGE